MKTREEIALTHLRAGGKVERIIKLDVYRDGGTMVAITDARHAYSRSVNEPRWQSDCSEEPLTEIHSAYIDQRCLDYADELEEQAGQVRKRLTK